MRRNKKAKSLFITFLCSYLLVLLVPIAIGGISYTYSMRSIKAEMEKYNVAMLQQAQRVLNERLRSINQLALDIALNSRIDTFLSVYAPIPLSNMYDMSKVVSELSKYKQADDFIDDIYIYFKNSDVIIDSNAKYDPEFFHQKVLPYTGWGYDDWKEWLLQNHFREYKPAQPVMFYSKSKEVITYSQSLPFRPNAQALATLIISIDESKIEELLKDINILNQGIVYIVDSHNRVIINIGGKGSIKYFGYDELPSDKNFFYDSIDGHEVIVSYISSRITDWKYVSQIPIDAFMNDTKRLKNLIIKVVIAELAIGIILAFLLAVKNYAPIRRIIDGLRCTLRTNHNDLNVKNEWDFIEKVTASTMAENEDMKNVLSEQQPLLRATLLSQLLKGNIVRTENLIRLFQSADIAFDYNLFCVLAICIEDFDKITKSHIAQDMISIKSILADVMEKLASKENCAYIVDMDLDNLALIINMPIDSDVYKKRIYEIALQAKEFMFRQYGIFISIGIGAIHFGLLSVRDSYHEAMNALGYRNVKKAGDIVAFDDIRKGKIKYFYSIETESKLISCIKTGDTKGANELVEKIFWQNFEIGDLSMDVAHCLFFDILGTFFKVLNDIDEDYGIIFSDDPFKSIAADKSICDMCQGLKRICSDICRYINKNKKSHNEELKVQVLDYIEQHWQDNSLSLSKVADVLCVNASYLSHFFKEQVGENFVDYISKVRINKAKQILIESPKISLQSLAETIGYANKNTLIRIFRKYEGITPGEYKKMIINGLQRQ